MNVNYHLNRTKRSSWLVLLFFIVCTIIIIGISAYTSISPLVREAWADSVIATIPVGDLPVLIAFNPDNGDMYVVNHESDTVSGIDGNTNTVIGSPIPVGDHSSGIVCNTNNGDLYVANGGPTTGCCGTASVIEGKT